MRILALAGLMLAFGAAPAQANLWGKVKITCGQGDHAQVDPLAARGVPVSAHDHTSQGARAFTAATTTGEMLAAPTTCLLREDHSLSWAPTMIKDGVSYGAGMSTYYAANGANPASIAGGRIEPPPNGLRFVAGNPDSSVLQSTTFIRWRCGQNVNTYQAPPGPACGTSFSMEIDGPECWDGMNLDSADHRSHVARHSTDGGCPATHPIRFPQEQISFTYSAAALGGELSCERPGAPAGACAHFDYWFAHDPAQIDQITRCLNDPARNSPNSPSCGVFTYLPNPWESRVSAWAQVVGYVDSSGNPTYGSTPPVTP